MDGDKVVGSPFSEDENPITGINITPFVDVMLVLLVIFMVTATTIVKSSLDVALPEMTQDAVQDKKETLEVQMSTSGKVQWNTHSVSLAELDAFLTNQPAALPQGPLSISADKDLSHGDVIRLIDTFKKKGVKEISLNVIVH